MSAPTCATVSPAKRSTSTCGTAASFTGGENAAFAAFPERTRRKHLGPPGSPPHQGLPARAQLRAQPVQPPSSEPLLHRCREHHDRSEVDPAAEETRRRRRASSTTRAGRARVTEPPIVLGREHNPVGHARLAWVPTVIEPTTAMRAPFALRRGGEVGVELQQQRKEPGIPEQLVAQGASPFTRGEWRGTPSSA